MTIRIRRVESDAERRAIYRLRYDVYIEELGRTQHYADHARRCIEEPLDASSQLFGAFDGVQCVGTVRCTYGRDGGLGIYESLYEMDSVGPAHPSCTSVTTKLLVAAHLRNTTLAYRLSVATYQQAVMDGILFDFIDVYPPRVPFFERLGYEVHLPARMHEEFGNVIVMRLALRDVTHLAAVKSPFLSHLLRAQQLNLRSAV
jgi:hypothetical protein